MNDESEYVSATDAVKLLEVKLPTLYAYASRGLVESIPAPRGRRRLYRLADLDRLVARRQARAGRGAFARGAFAGGGAALRTGITLLDPEVGPTYRGRGALALAAADVPFELVAELLWTGAMPDVGTPEAAATAYQWSHLGLGLPEDAVRGLLPSAVPPLPLLSALVPLLACRDGGRFAKRADVVAPRARTLILRLAAGLGLKGPAQHLDAACGREWAGLVRGGCPANSKVQR